MNGWSYFFTGGVMHPLANNFMLPLYLVFLFSFSFMGSDELCYLHKIMLICCSYCSFSFLQNVIHFASNSHLINYLPLCFYHWMLPGSLLS